MGENDKRKHGTFPDFEKSERDNRIPLRAPIPGNDDASIFNTRPPPPPIPPERPDRPPTPEEK